MTSLLQDGVDALRARQEPLARRGAVTAAALAMIIVSTALRAWAVSGGWFFGDDFLFLSDVARGDADVAWLFHRHNLHVMPLSFALVLPVAHAGAFAWWAAATELIVFQVASALACWWMLRTVFGNRPRILLPLAVYLFSSITVTSLMWWAAGLNSLAVQPFMFGAIGCHVLLLRTGRRRWALAAAACVVVALLLYVKAALIVPMLAIITLVYAAQGPLPRRVWSTLVRYRFAWTAYALPLVIYLVAYFSSSPPKPPGDKPDYGQLADRFVLSNLSSAALGGPWQWLQLPGGAGPRQLADPPQGAVVISAMLIAAAAVLLVLRYRGALLPLWFLVPYTLATVGLLAYGRAGAFGGATTYEVRYWADFVPYVALGIGLAVMPIVGLPRVLVPRNGALFDNRRMVRVGVAYVVVFVIGSVASTIGYVKPWHEEFEARRFITTAVNELESQKQPVALADQSVPGVVMPELFFPTNLASRTLAPVGDRFTTPDIANDIQVLDDNGLIVPGFAGEDFVVAEDRLDTCLSGSDRNPQILFGSRTFDFPFWLSMSYRSDGDADVTVTVGDTSYDTRILEGAHTLSLRTEGANDRIRFTLPPGSRLCVDSMNIATRMVPR
ncbi:hypothetical protein GEV29_14390 [Aeromicrobium sp. SMF47]|uniref:hypothetical protein n=1 Tax=Aeromicrobium TaxID=2040 RepID=UPI00129ECE1C|nr:MULTISPECIES: hypothetical protein [Aeromicrobium]MRJ77730.1 hypothetical protein [Aeromicrobium yanjiei]MRK02099.1 hypothetical protein [Aeromicrobium sp. S22]